jgi:hypothetical protein
MRPSFMFHSHRMYHAHTHSHTHIHTHMHIQVLEQCLSCPRRRHTVVVPPRRHSPVRVRVPVAEVLCFLSVQGVSMVFRCWEIFWEGVKAVRGPGWPAVDVQWPRWQPRPPPSTTVWPWQARAPTVMPWMCELHRGPHDSTRTHTRTHTHTFHLFIVFFINYLVSSPLPRALSLSLPLSLLC